MKIFINIFMDIFNSLNKTLNFNIYISFKVMYKIKIIKNYSTVIFYKFLILILRMQNLIDKIIITSSIK